MSMMGGNPRTPQNVGETIAQYSEYEAAQKAVSKLIAADIPAREISIVWANLRAVEMVTARLGYARAAWSGALNGALLGLLIGAVFVLISPEVSLQLLLGALLVGTAVGMLMQLLSFILVRRRRDYSSITQPVADHYEVAVAGSHASTARQLLGQQQSRRTPQPSGPLPPPKYGVRVDPATDRQAPGASESSPERSQAADPTAQADETAAPESPDEAGPR